MSTPILTPKPGGPRTPEGKAISSQNALKHGLFSKNLLLESESQPEFDGLLADYTKRYQPLGISEQDLVFEIAVARLRIRRAWFYETAILEYEPPVVSEEIAGEKTNSTEEMDERTRIALSFGADKDKAKAISLIHRYEARLRRTYERALKELAMLRELRVAEALDEHLEAAVQRPAVPVPKQPVSPTHTNDEIRRSATYKDLDKAVCALEAQRAAEQAPFCASSSKAAPMPLPPPL